MSGVRDILQNRDLFHAEENDTVASVVRRISSVAKFCWDHRAAPAGSSYFHKSFNLGELPSGAAGKRTGFDSESASAALKRWSSSPCL